ncbi:hypothetical protein [Clostridium sp.]|uniref:hypothetical protein n=1 Tax=Clostridium sp. TaxID=1506 RepID=UPI003D6D8948
MIKHNHKFLIVLVGVASFVCVIAFLLIRNNMNTKTFDDFIGKPNPNISKMGMFDWNTGKSVSTTDKIKIQEIVTLLKNRNYHKVADQRTMVNGGNYSYEFYVDNKVVLGIGDHGDVVNIYGTNYKTTIIPNDGLKNWYNSLIASPTVAKDFSNKLFEVGSVKMEEYKDLVAAGLNVGAVDIIGAEGVIKADKIAHANYLKTLKLFDRHIEGLMTKEAYENCIKNRYNTLISEICDKGNYTTRVTDVILGENLYNDKEGKVGYNYEIKLLFTYMDVKAVRYEYDMVKGSIGLSRVNDQWKVSDFKITVKPKLSKDRL